MANRRRSVFNPIHFKVVRLHLDGHTQQDISRMTGLTPSAVNLILLSPEAQETLEAIKANYLDTMLEVQTQAQLVAPEMLKLKIDLAMNSLDERVRSINAKEVLEIAGHKPDTRLILQRTEDAQAGEHAEATPEELRQQLLAAVAKAPTVH
jgi:hypothetical protein